MLNGMHLHSLELEGFASYRDRCHLDLADVTACAVIGPNGAGKSSLVEALLWTIYGETSERAADAIINNDTDSARCVVEFEDADGRMWTVERARRRSGSQQARASCGNRTIDGAREVAQAMSETLGGGASTLCVTAFARQGAAGLFATGTAASRRELLQRGMPGIRFAAMLEEAQRQHSTAGDTALRSGDAVARAETLAEQRSQLAENLAEARREAEAAEAAREALESVAAGADPSGITAKLREARQAERDLAAAREQLEAAQRGLSDGDSTVDRLREAAETAAAASEAAEAEAEAAATAVAAAREKAAGSASLGQEAKQRLDLLDNHDNGCCWVCGSLLDSDAMQKLRDDLAERITVAERHQRTAERRAKDSKAATRAATTARQDTEAAQRAVSDAEAALARHRETIARQTERISMLKPRAEGIEELAAAAAAAAEQDETLLQAAHARERERRAREAVGSAQRQLDEAEAAAEQLPGLRYSAVEAETAQTRTGHLVAAMRPSGAPQVAMESITSSIGAAANRFLADMGNLQIRFRASGDKTRGMLIHARGSDLVWRPYMTFSGGERMRLDIALRIAMCETLRVRSSLLVLDEGWGALDAAGTHQLASVLDRVVADGVFGQVLTISHVDAAVNVFPQRIEVDNDNGTSTAAVTLAA